MRSLVRLLGTLTVLPAAMAAVPAEAATWTSIGPFASGGRIVSLAVDPRTASTVYAGNIGAAGGRVFKTTDGGASWQLLGEGLPPSSVLALAIDPAEPDTLYAGLEVYSTEGLFKSVDGARTWTAAGAGLPRAPITALAIDPGAPAVLYTGSTSRGVFKSTDAGGSWRAINAGLPGPSVTRLAIDPKDPQTVYAGLVFSGVFKSTDGGENWTPANAGLMTTISVLAVDPVSPSTLYAGGGGISKSTDGGLTWTEVNHGLPQYPAISALAVHPSSPGTVLAAGRGLFKTTDGGASWTEKSAGLLSLSESPTSLAIAPTSHSTVYAGSSSYAEASGVIKSGDAGETWQAVNNGLRGFRVRDIAVSSGSPPTLFAGTEEDGVFRSSDGGVHWKQINTGLRDLRILDLAADPGSLKTLYATTYSGIFKSVDGGSNWTPANDGLPAGSFFVSLAIDPVSPSVLYAGGFGAVFKSLNGGTLWTLVSNEAIGAIVVHPSSSSVLYGAALGGTSGSIVKSTDGGTTWTAVLSTSCESATAIAIDPRNPSTLFAATSYSCPLPGIPPPPGRIWRSQDAGASWTDVTNGVPVGHRTDLAIAPGDRSTVYLSGGIAVFRARDGGATWVRHGGEFPYPSALELAPGSSPPALYAGTLGGSVFKTSLGADFHTVSPCRVADTRSAAGAYGGPALLANTDRVFVIGGQCAIPAGALAVSINVTVTGPTDKGDLRVSPASGTLSPAPVLSYSPGKTRSNNAILPLGPSGDIAVRGVQPTGSVHLIADINGYFDYELSQLAAQDPRPLPTHDPWRP